MAKELTFKEAIELARKSIKEFEKVEQKKWGIQGTMIELSKQVGDLAKDVMMAEKYYLPERQNRPEYRTSKEDIGDELADIFYCLVRIADHYGIDLEKSHAKARKKEMESLGKE